jgi:mono/diheme cytochrome c family protein/glucose/arabinose dehydrogenase
MRSKKKWILAAMIAVVCLYACRVAYIAQYPVERDADGRIKVIAKYNPAPETPEESMKHIYLPKGYHLQLVASEPMISQPVAVVWDGNGVMYVAEMLTYMLNVDGTGEGMKLCTVKRLEDTNGDGVMDKSSVFIDSLVLPRMMLCIGHKLLVNETNTYNIYSYEDTNGDGKADKKVQVFKNDESDTKNLEHQKSGLIWNLDNRIYVTVDPVRYQWKSDHLVADSLLQAPQGQWGLTYDNYGRLFYSQAGAEIPALNFQQNPHYGAFDVKDQFNTDFMAVWPAIATPDVQGGLMRLRADSTLNHFTACNGQSIYRGDKLPMDARGDLFIPEPVGRLIRRAKLSDVDGKITMVNAYDKTEFIQSTDPNFRPVNTVTGPDGSMYIVDMYHGIIQESTWTRPGSFLRPKILQHGYEKNIGRGRIYRLVYEGMKPDKNRPHLLDETAAQLVNHLTDANGWYRDNAQKELVARGDKSVVPALRTMANTSPNQLARIHALWTLNGLESLDMETFTAALKNPDPAIRKNAVWAGEDMAKTHPEVTAMLANMKDDLNPDVRYQVSLSLRFNNSPVAKDAVSYLVNKYPDNIIGLSDKTYHEKIKAKADQLRAQALLAEADRKLVSQGSAIFKQLCSTCHGQDGKGITIGGGGPTAPALASNPDVNGNPVKLIRILLMGLGGPIRGQGYPDVMPALGFNTDEYIASALSYIRNDFGNKAPAVREADVARIRALLKDRTKNFTMAELDTMRTPFFPGFRPGAGGAMPPRPNGGQ